MASVEAVEGSEWITIYPIYLDKNHSVGHGRRVCKEVAVPNVKATEIATVCAALSLHYEIQERKCHPADFGNPGRVRVRLQDIRGNYTNPEIKCRRSLYLSLVEKLPSLKSRQTTPAITNATGKKR